VLGCVIVLTQNSSVAQQSRLSPSRKQAADMQLNRNYQQLMKTLPPPAKEQLRKAEHAWLDFVVRNRAAFQAAAPQLGLSASQCEDMEADEFFNRANQLSRLSAPNQSANNDDALRLTRTDEELNVVYQRCLSSVTGADAQKLRDAQNMWNAFRDAHNGFAPYLLLTITNCRIEQLHNFYIKTDRHPEQQPSQHVEEKADASVPDPFERARK